MLYRLVICPGSPVSRYCVPVGCIQLPLTLPLINLARFHAYHRHTHDLFVEVHDPKCELTGTAHLRHPRGLGLVCCAGAYPPTPTGERPSSPRSSKASRKRRKWRSLNLLSSPASTQLKRPARCEAIASKATSMISISCSEIKETAKSMWFQSALRQMVLVLK